MSPAINKIKNLRGIFFMLGHRQLEGYQLTLPSALKKIAQCVW